MMNDFSVQPIKVYGEDFYKSPDNFSVLAYVVDACNLACKYCYNTFPRCNARLDLDKLLSFISYIRTSTSRRKIYLDLIGGEPTLHSNLVSFCKQCSRQIDDIEITVYTNFSQSFEYYCELLRCNTNLIISWHSGSNDDEFKKKFQRFCNDDIENKIYVSIMYEHDNISRSLDMFDWFSQNYPNLKRLYFSLLDANKNYNGRQYSDDDIETFKKRLSRTITPNTVLEYSDGRKEYVSDNYFFSNQLNKNFKRWLCNAGRDYVYVHFDGSIHPCDENDSIILGNINNLSGFRLPSRKMLCNREQCPCLFDIFKEKVFK